MTLFNLFIDPRPSPKIISTKIWIEGGSRCDEKKKRGSHQLLGSLLTRGCGPYSFFKLTDLIENCGANLDCETFEDGLLLSLKCISDDAEKLIPILGWMIKEPHLEDKYLNIEKKLAIQSIKRQQENPFFVAYDSWRQITYRDSGYGHDPLGIIDEIKEIKNENLINLANTIPYRNKSIALSGSVNENIKDKLLSIEPFNELFNNNINTENLYVNFKNNEIFNNKISMNFQNTNQIVFILGNSTVGYNHDDFLILNILSCHLGSGMSSKLFKELREKNGLAYDVGTHFPLRDFNTPFLIHASSSVDKGLVTITLIKRILYELKENLISEDELSLAKAKYKGHVALMKQTSSQIAERRVRLTNYKNQSDYDNNNLEKLERLSIGDIKKVSIKYLANPNISICGPKNIVSKAAKEWLRN